MKEFKSLEEMTIKEVYNTIKELAIEKNLMTKDDVVALRWYITRTGDIREFGKIQNRTKNGYKDTGKYFELYNNMTLLEISQNDYLELARLEKESYND